MASYGDNNWYVFNAATTTKQFRFNAVNIAAATTRIYDAPNASGALALLNPSPALIQTFTGEVAFTAATSLKVTTTNTNVVPFKLYGAVGQIADLLTIYKDSSGAISTLRVNGNGTLQLANALAGNLILNTLYQGAFDGTFGCKTGIPLTGARSWYTPDDTGTLTLLEANQTFITGTKSFGSGTAIFGSGNDGDVVPRFIAGTVGATVDFLDILDNASLTNTGYKITFSLDETSPLTSDIRIRFPSGAGTLATTSNTTTFTNKTFSGTGTYIRCGTGHARFADATSTTIYFNIDNSPLTGVRTYKTFDETGYLIMAGNTAVAAAGTAVVNTFGKADYTNQSAAIAATTILTGHAVSGGVYVLHANAICRTATSLGDIDYITLSVTYTSNGVARTITLANTLSLDATTKSEHWHVTVHADASTAISFAIGYTDVGIGTDGAYDFHARLVALG